MLFRKFGGKNMTSNRLSETQKLAYKENGYLIGLPPVFNRSEVNKLNEGLSELSEFLLPGETHFHMNGWHSSSRWLYDICANPQILDYVEDLLGPDFYMWGTHFFSKKPGSKETVSWHQDAPYWPLNPHNSVTVWVAFTDVDEQNGAMQVISGTHREGLIKHRSSEDSTNVLGLELENSGKKQQSLWYSGPVKFRSMTMP